MTRRDAMSAAAVAAAALAAGAGLAITASRAHAQRAAVSSAGGIAGGGLIDGVDGPIHFSLFASRLPLGPDGEALISGRVQVRDDGRGHTFESVTVDAYGPVEGEDPNLRQLSGTMLVTTEDDAEGTEYPFVLRAVDNGGLGEAGDRLEILIGAAAPATPGATGAFEFGYDLSAPLEAGDIQLLEFPEIEE